MNEPKLRCFMPHLNRPTHHQAGSPTTSEPSAERYDPYPHHSPHLTSSHPVSSHLLSFLSSAGIDLVALCALFQIHAPSRLFACCCGIVNGHYANQSTLPDSAGLGNNPTAVVRSVRMGLLMNCVAARPPSGIYTDSWRLSGLSEGLDTTLATGTESWPFSLLRANERPQSPSRPLAQQASAASMKWQR